MIIKLFDIILFAIIASTLAALIWELIPEGTKSFWDYIHEVRKADGE